ncbi:hypothetical protein SAMN02910292_02157 [Lachnospiraceae bacterium XBB2008]|nr:hypothetical protein SAMN02910292_02157 [Lachnospiraceae bacterium XBB2008]
MIINTVNCNIVSLDRLANYMYYIKTDELPLIKRGEAVVFGIDSLTNDHIGAAVAETAPEPDNGPGHVLVIRDMYLVEEYRTPEVFDGVINKISEEVIRRDYTGIVMQNAYPDDPVYESYLEDKAFRLDDGNTIYEVDVDCIYDHPIFKKTVSGLNGSIKKISDLDMTEKMAFMSEWGGRFPKGLSCEHLPGKWLQSFSYVYEKGSEFKGFVLTSELSSEKLYIGGIYSEPGLPLVPAALITVLGRDVILDSDYRKVMFAAATDEGSRLCEKVLEGIHSIRKWKIHNYYLEV